jgi:hypothetical protein
MGVDAENQHAKPPMTICFTFVEAPRLIFEQTSKEIFDYSEEPAALQARTTKDTPIRWSVRLVCGM